MLTPRPVVPKPVKGLPRMGTNPERKPMPNREMPQNKLRNQPMPNKGTMPLNKKRDWTPPTPQEKRKMALDGMKMVKGSK